MKTFLTLITVLFISTVALSQGIGGAYNQLQTPKDGVSNSLQHWGKVNQQNRKLEQRTKTIESTSPKLDFDLFDLVDKLSKISFWSINRFMIEGYKFKELKSEDDDYSNERMYIKTYNKNPNNAIGIRVSKLKNEPNAVIIFLAKNYKIEDFKNKLIANGYKFIGYNDGDKEAVYGREKSFYYISNEVKKGIKKILVLKEK